MLAWQITVRLTGPPLAAAAAAQPGLVRHEALAAGEDATDC